MPTRIDGVRKVFTYLHHREVGVYFGLRLV